MASLGMFEGSSFQYSYCCVGYRFHRRWEEDGSPPNHGYLVVTVLMRTCAGRREDVPKVVLHEADLENYLAEAVVEVELVVVAVEMAVLHRLVGVEVVVVLQEVVVGVVLHCQVRFQLLHQQVLKLLHRLLHHLEGHSCH